MLKPPSAALQGQMLSILEVMDKGPKAVQERLDRRGNGIRVSWDKLQDLHNGCILN